MPALIRTARTTGLLYLGLAITGLLGFLLIRPQLFEADDPAATLANLVEHQSLARAGIALRAADRRSPRRSPPAGSTACSAPSTLAAGGIAAFGLVNAVAILVSAAMLATALQVALDPVGDAAPPPNSCTWSATTCGASARCSSACG